jgi:anti-sigma factor RsiW
MTLLGGHLGSRASALLDGQLSPEDAERAWAHVQECPTCRDQVEREAWLKRRLAGLGRDPDAAAPATLRDELRCAPRLAPGDLLLGLERHRGRRTLVIAALGGGAVGAAIMGILAFGAGPADAPTFHQHTPVTAITPNAPTIAATHFSHRHR